MYTPYNYQLVSHEDAISIEMEQIIMYRQDQALKEFAELVGGRIRKDLFGESRCRKIFKVEKL